MSSSSSSPDNKASEDYSLSSPATMMDNQSLSKKLKYILICYGEAYIGYHLAMYINEELARREGQLKKKHWRVRVLCEDKKNMKDLEKRGVEVREVDYLSQSMIREQMKDKIKTMIFNPFPKRDEHLIKQGKNILESACHMKIKRIMMLSLFGCSQYLNEESSVLGKFCMLEEQLRDSYKYGYYAIFRTPMIQQFFYYWSEMIQKKHSLGLPISESNMLETVNIKDVCNCFAQAALSKKSMVWCNQIQDGQRAPSARSGNDDGSSDDTSTDEKNIEESLSLKRVYNLTCTLPMNPLMISEAIRNACKKEGFDTHIKPVVIMEEQLKDYLETIAKEEQNSIELDALLSNITMSGNAVFDTSGDGNKQRASSADKSTTAANSGLFSNLKSMFISNAASSGPIHGGEPDSPEWYPHPSMFLTPLYIKILLNHFRYARSPCPPIVLPTNDVRDITGCDPVELGEFFISNRRRFCSDM